MPGALSRSTRIGLIALAALAVFGVLVGTGANAGIAFFFCLPVGLASWWFGPRAGLLVTTVCICLYAVNDAVNPVPEFALAIVIRAVFFLAVAALVSSAAQRLRALEHSAEELEAIRAALAPAELPEVPGVDAAAAFVPSELGVSGDFYLLTNGPDGSTVAIVGDVVGHGPAAARLATFIRARFAALAASTSDPAELLTLANTALAELAADGSTFLLGAEEQLELANTESSIDGSEGLVIYTDGATDVRQGREMLGLEGLRRLLTPLPGLSAKVITGEIERAILAWADRPIRDDLCLLVLKPNPEHG